LHVFYQGRDRPVQDAFDFGQVHLHLPLTNDDAEVFNFLDVEVALLWLDVMVRSPCRRSAAVEKCGSREVHYVELQSHSLQQVEREVICGNIASRGASEILRRLRITQGK
jgi:hypothetical protein